MHQICCLILVVFSFGSAARGDDPVPRDNFAVYPVTTPLQRTLLSWSDEEGSELKAYVSVNGEAVVNAAGLIDERALKLASLRNALKPYTNRENEAAVLTIHWKSAPGRNQDAGQLLVWGLEGFAVRDIGFKTARGWVTYHNDRDFDWAKTIDAAKRKIVAGADQSEEALDSEFVNVYPVQTELSRLLTGNADCVVDVLAPPEGGEELMLKPIIRKVIVRLVGQADLRDKKAVSFLIKGGMGKIQQQGGVEKYMKELDDLAKELGFAGSSVSAR